MEVGAEIRDWVVAGIIIYIAIRYALLRGVERAAFSAQIEQLKGFTAASLVRDLQDAAAGLEIYSRKVRELEAELDKTKGAAKMTLGAGYTMGLANGLWEGLGAIDELRNSIPLILGGSFSRGPDKVFSEKTKALWSASIKALKGEKPSLAHRDRFFERVRKFVEEKKKREAAVKT